MHCNEHGWLWSPKFLTIAVPVYSGYRRTVAMLWRWLTWYLMVPAKPLSANPWEPHRCNHFVIDDPNLCGTVHWLDLGDSRHLPMAIMASKKPNKSHLGGTWKPWITIFKLQWWYVEWICMTRHAFLLCISLYNTCTPVQDHPFLLRVASEKQPHLER